MIKWCLQCSESSVLTTTAFSESVTVSNVNLSFCTKRNIHDLHLGSGPTVRAGLSSKSNLEVHSGLKQVINELLRTSNLLVFPKPAGSRPETVTWLAGYKRNLKRVIHRLFPCNVATVLLCPMPPSRLPVRA